MLIHTRTHAHTNMCTYTRPFCMHACPYTRMQQGEDDESNGPWDILDVEAPMHTCTHAPVQRHAWAHAGPHIGSVARCDAAHGRLRHIARHNEGAHAWCVRVHVCVCVRTCACVCKRAPPLSELSKSMGLPLSQAETHICHVLLGWFSVGNQVLKSRSLV